MIARRINTLFVLGLLALLLSLVLTPPVQAQPNLAFERAFPKLPLFIKPVFFTYMPDGSGRVVVIEQTGRIYSFDNNDEVAATKLIGDVSTRTQQDIEEGLLGLAFHPKFKENGQVFLNFTAKGEPRRNIIARFTMDATRSVILPHSQEIILEVHQPQNNHNGGMLAFGTDGYLYIAFGDGGGGGDWPMHGPFGNAQNKDALLGKILRIDVDKKADGKAYAIPPDNPFVGQEHARPEVYAWGLRNPWRFSFDRKTNELWAGDVGQYFWEEVDIIEKGKNYGWNQFEGTHRFRPKAHDEPEQEFTAPVAEHAHGEAKCVIGGYVYRGAKIPELQGWYLHGDFSTRLVWVMRLEDGKPTKPKFMGQSPGPPSSFGEDEAGEVYIVGYSGEIYRVVAAK